MVPESYNVYKNPPPVPVLSQINPVHAPTSHFLKIHLCIILSYMPGYSKWSFSLMFPRQNPICTSPFPHTCLHAHPSHSSRFDQPNYIIIFIDWLIVSGYAWCCQARRVWALNQVAAGTLHNVMLKCVYKAGNIINLCGWELPASLSYNWTSSFRNSLTVQ